MFKEGIYVSHSGVLMMHIEYSDGPGYGMESWMFSFDGKHYYELTGLLYTVTLDGFAYLGEL